MAEKKKTTTKKTTSKPSKAKATKATSTKTATKAKQKKAAVAPKSAKNVVETTQVAVEKTIQEAPVVQEAPVETVETKEKAPYNVFGWYLEAWLNFANFRGRANRTEFFAFGAINALFVMALLLSASFYASALTVFEVFSLLTIIPTFAVLVRRFHDVNLRGFWAFIPPLCWLIIVGIVIFGFLNDIIVSDNQALYISNQTILIVIGCFTIFALSTGLISFIITLWKGNRGANRFGPAPLKAKTSAVVSLWILIFLVLSAFMLVGMVEGYTKSINGATYAIDVPEESVAGTQFMDESLMKVKDTEEIQKTLEAYMKISLESLRDPEFTTEAFDDVEIPEFIDFIAAENGVVSMNVKKSELADMLVSSGLSCDNNTCVFDGQKVFSSLPEGVDPESLNISVSRQSVEEIENEDVGVLEETKTEVSSDEVVVEKTETVVTPDAVVVEKVEEVIEK